MPKQIDENLLKGLIAGDTPPPVIPQETETAPVTDAKENKRKKGQVPDYSVFLSPGILAERQIAYISKEHQELIYKIVILLRKRNLSMSTYIDNVLREHFATYENEINALLEKQCKNLIKKE